MINGLIKYSWLLLVAIIVNGAASIQVYAEGFNRPSEALILSRGGKIYDNWSSALKTIKPSKTHPAYPATGSKKGSSTWRCKECHGWDYRGRDGIYSKGSHYTGIKGIREMAGKPMSSIKKVVRNKQHSYTKTMIPDKDLDNLAYFISKGQIDMTQYIDSETKKVQGSAQRGANYFQTICAICHGPDGRKINFHDPKKTPEFIGTVASKNPWELFHKLRHGQPGAAMISLQALEVQVQLDILAYTQLLPTE